MCLSADWAVLALSNSFLHCFVLCVWVRGSRSCICSRLLLSSLFRLVCCLCASRVVFFSCAAGLLSFAAAVRCLWLVAVSFLFCPCVLGACGLARSLLVSPPPSLPTLVSPLCLLVQLVLCSLRCNGPVVIPSIWRVLADWLLSSLLLMATKASPCVGLCPLHHVVGVVQVPLAPALRYSPLGDPETP